MSIATIAEHWERCAIVEALGKKTAIIEAVKRFKIPAMLRHEIVVIKIDERHSS